MEEMVYKIWSILSSFEESSAACISDMLLNVSNGAYTEGVLIAKRFIAHVEVLFTAIDQLAAYIKSQGLKGEHRPPLSSPNVIRALGQQLIVLQTWPMVVKRNSYAKRSLPSSPCFQKPRKLGFRNLESPRNFCRWSLVSLITSSSSFGSVSRVH